MFVTSFVTVFFFMDRYLSIDHQAALYCLYSNEQYIVRIAESSLRFPYVDVDLRFIILPLRTRQLLFELYTRGYCISIRLKRHVVDTCGCDLDLSLCVDYHGDACPKRHLQYSSRKKRDLKKLDEESSDEKPAALQTS